MVAETYGAWGTEAMDFSNSNSLMPCNDFGKAQICSIAFMGD